MVISVSLGAQSYPILLEPGALARAGAHLSLDRRVLVVTDSGVPQEYAQAIASRCRQSRICTLPAGEGSKSMDSYHLLLREMLRLHMDRGDCVAAVGGGMVGDLAGFAAACFMRGVDFYNLPTTLLSQVDSSIGGKTGVNLDGVKNIVGAFWQPRGVLIDPDALDTLPPRLWAEGMAEYVKMALTLDGELFAALQREDPRQDMTRTLERALGLKKNVVERDEREAGPRKLLNFGHTIGHGVESAAGGALYHGECVALGMLPMCSPAVRAQLRPVLERLGLPTSTGLDKQTVWEAMLHDKKSNSGGFSAVFVEEPGKGYVKNVSFAEMRAILEGAWQA